MMKRILKCLSKSRDERSIAKIIIKKNSNSSTYRTCGVNFGANLPINIIAFVRIPASGSLCNEPTALNNFSMAFSSNTSTTKTRFLSVASRIFGFESEKPDNK